MRTLVRFKVVLCLLAVGWVQAVGQEPPIEQQIAEALSPLPEALRASATVRGFQDDGSLTTLREGSGEFYCLANNPKRRNYHVVCYHGSLEPYMARGRELRAEGKSRSESRDIRAQEIEAGTLEMPKHAALYSLTGPKNPETGRPDSVASLFVIYTPFTTPEDIGVSDAASRSRPWLMFPGGALSHIMVSGGWRKP